MDCVLHRSHGGVGSALPLPVTRQRHPQLYRCGELHRALPVFLRHRRGEPVLADPEVLGPHPRPRHPPGVIFWVDPQLQLLERRDHVRVLVGGVPNRAPRLVVPPLHRRVDRHPAQLIDDRGGPRHMDDVVLVHRQRPLGLTDSRAEHAGRKRRRGDPPVLLGDPDQRGVDLDAGQFMDNRCTRFPGHLLPPAVISDVPDSTASRPGSRGFCIVVGGNARGESDNSRNRPHPRGALRWQRNVYRGCATTFLGCICNSLLAHHPAVLAIDFTITRQIHFTRIRFHSEPSPHILDT